ncbi:S-adenosyl-L-methionine-dependent methyltransferase [Thelonectria olida]|uniref:S-adenosyl-L-methionine-dependent methyltransferase n=1 Tax=Thelonectria olida TaxID=1576542 RepID=A0A9P8VTW9_9HYPO|nr:S-adenosyl-L-methionine-dependent methyltransferase [Thelonectria olida]
MQEQIAVDPDFDSALEVPLEEPSTSSLRSSLLQFAQENGRTYHRMSEGKYVYPNDDAENDRLDLQNHLYLITLDGKQALNPGVATAKRVLDMGTGTGIWAVDFADEHPDAEVIGVDLSPIQPAFVPPNCIFEIDDLEKEWTWKTPFDFIFSRMMTGSFAKPEAMAKKAYEGLSPGGWYEIQDIQLPVFCDDNSLDPETSPVMKWQKGLIEASKQLGRPLGFSDQYKDILQRAGFQGIEETIYRWPTSSWPQDKKLKEIGKWNLANFNAGLEGVSLALFTRVLSWSKDEVLSLCAEVRKELRNPQIHAYWKIYVVYGQRPIVEEEGENAA